MAGQQNSVSVPPKGWTRIQKFIIGGAAGTALVVIAAIAIAISLGATQRHCNCVIDPNLESVESGGESGLLKVDKYLFTETDVYEIVQEYDGPSTLPSLMTVGYSDYPCYNSSSVFNDTTTITGIIDENNDFMDQLLELSKAGTLKRHPFSDRQWDSGSVDYNVKRAKVRIGFNPTMKSWHPIIWALPGEIVTVVFPSNFQSYSAMEIGIGNSDESDNLLTASVFVNQRMPIISRNFNSSMLQQYVENDSIKIGSPLGGMIYVSCSDTTIEPFNITASGGVLAPIYIFGSTTDLQWSKLQKSPGLVAEVRLPHLRIVATSKYVRNSNVKKASEFFYRAISLSDIAVEQQSFQTPIMLRYGTGIYCGAACAIVGAWYSQLPSSWATDFFDIESTLQYGCWGSVHEMNHHDQGSWGKGGQWGMSGQGEITNNVMNTMAYSLYTNIGASRSETGGLDGWNYVSDPYYTMKDIIDGTGSSYDLHFRAYIGIHHAFGSDVLIKLVHSYYHLWYDNDYANIYNISRTSQSAFCLLSSVVTQRDMRYYCALFNYTIAASVNSAIAAMNLKTYYPIFNLYTMGLNGVITGRPFTIPAGMKYKFDFKKYMTVDSSVSYTIKSISGFSKGTLVNLGDDIYEYTSNFSATEKDSFNMIISIGGQTANLYGEVALNPYSVVVQRWEPVTNDLETAIMESGSRYPNETTYVRKMGITRYVSWNNHQFFKATGRMYTNTSGFYTLFLLADDSGKLLFDINGDGNMAVICSPGYQLTYSATEANASYTLFLNSSKDYKFVLYNLNQKGYYGQIKVGYAFHGSEVVNVSTLSIQDVGEDMVLSPGGTHSDLPNSTFDIPEALYWRNPNNLGSYYNCLLGNNVTSYNVPKSAGSGDPSVLFDGNTSTFYHTSYSGAGGATSFPADFIFEFENSFDLNFVAISFRHWYDSFGGYSISTGTSNDSFTVMASGFADGESTIEINLDYLARDVKWLKITAINNTYGYDHVVPSEIKLGVAGTFSSFADITLDNSAGEMTSKLVIGAGHNTIIEGTGTVSFSFEGSSFGLYATKSDSFGSMNVTVDSTSYTVPLSSQEVSNRELVFIKFFSLASQHNVTLTPASGAINIDIVGWS